MILKLEDVAFLHSAQLGELSSARQTLKEAPVALVNLTTLRVWRRPALPRDSWESRNGWVRSWSILIHKSSFLVCKQREKELQSVFPVWRQIISSLFGRMSVILRCWASGRILDQRRHPWRCLGGVTTGTDDRSADWLCEPISNPKSPSCPSMEWVRTVPYRETDCWKAFADGRSEKRGLKSTFACSSGTWTSLTATVAGCGRWVDFVTKSSTSRRHDALCHHSGWATRCRLLAAGLPKC